MGARQEMASSGVQSRFFPRSGNSQDALSTEGPAALRHRLATPHGGVGDRGIELCRGRVLAFHHSGIVPGGALILSVYMHTGAGLTQENWQILSTVGQRITSQALPFVIGGDFQVEPKQLEDSGWRRRWLRGGAAAHNGHAVASGHRFLRLLPTPRRRV